MRNDYKNIFKTFFHENLYLRRSALGLTHDQMAQILAMAERSYIDLDHGKTGCSALTLALFLIYICEDPLVFLADLRLAFENAKKQAA